MWVIPARGSVDPLPKGIVVAPLPKAAVERTALIVADVAPGILIQSPLAKLKPATVSAPPSIGSAPINSAPEPRPMTACPAPPVIVSPAPPQIVSLPPPAVID